MGQHACKHVMVPPGEFAYLVMIHPQLCLAFFEALFNGPAQTAQPDQSAYSYAARSIADIIGVLPLFAYRSSDQQPNFLFRKSVVGQNHPTSRKFIFNRPLGSLRHFAAIPKIVMNSASQGFECNRVVGCVRQYAFGLSFAAIAVAFCDFDPVISG